MIPTKAEALELLEQARQKDPERNNCWARHSILVGDVAGKIAAAVNEKGQHFDVDRVAAMGYLHDIGKALDEFYLHPVKGYDYLMGLGYDEDFCAVCLTHSFVNNDPFCMFGEYMREERDKFLIEYIRKHQFTDEDNLLLLADCMACDEVMTVDKRMIDIIYRYGVCAKTQERIKEVYRIKRYFDGLLGYNLYNLFPEIKDNL